MSDLEPGNDDMLDPLEDLDKSKARNRDHNHQAPGQILSRYRPMITWKIMKGTPRKVKP